MNNYTQEADNHSTQVTNDDGCSNLYEAAQLQALPDIAQICGQHVHKLIHNNALAIGCPDDFLFLPFLSCCAALMGNKTSITVNETWTEAPIIWTMVGANSGTKKTAALKLLMTPLLEIQREQTRQWHLSRPSGYSSKSAPQILAGAMGMTRLGDVLENNDGQILSIVENIKFFHKSLGVNSEESREELFGLYEGVPKFHVSVGEVKVLESTCFNHTGFASPAYIMGLHNSESIKLSSRYLVSCSPDLEYSPISRSHPLPVETPSFKAIFQTLHTYHLQQRNYSFSTDAWKELASCHDNEWIGMMSQLECDKNKRTVIEKSLSQIVRVAGVIKALVNAFRFSKQQVENKIFQWDLTIDKDTVCRAIDLCKYFVDQKLTLMFGSGADLRMCNFTGSSGKKWVNVKDALRQLHQPKIHQQQVNHNQQQHILQHQQHEQQQHQQQRMHHQTQIVYLSENSNVQVSTSEDWVDHSTTEAQEEQQTADFVTMDKQMFVSVHAKRIKRLLECFDDGHGVSATTASQKSITPPVKLQGTNNRHPVWASALFFQKCQELGLGSAEQVKHPTNRKFYWRFKRKPVSDIGDKLQQLLTFLRVDMTQYCKIGPRPPAMPPMSPTTLFHSSGDTSTDFSETPDNTSTDDIINEPMESLDDDVQIVVKDEPL